MVYLLHSRKRDKGTKMQNIAEQFNEVVRTMKVAWEDLQNPGPRPLNRAGRRALGRIK